MSTLNFIYVEIKTNMLVPNAYFCKSVILVDQKSESLVVTIRRSSLIGKYITLFIQINLVFFEISEYSYQSKD